ncbi:GDSL-type esterase/lipase family protein [Streptosporangium sp. NPDC050855]|uniref:GDSL-type esterase/lipase family protein n=1 Tax=Streptosporangium sp. NPDC050855 TaxID=3366194 RepID=UPI0037B490BC
MTAFTGLAALTIAQAAPAWAARTAPTAPAAQAAQAAGVSGVARTAEPWRPRVMAALGDSISAGFNACGWYVPCASRSWSTGDHPSVRSHRLRMGDLGLAPRTVNLAVPGSTSAGLAAQVARAVERRADYVTILVGAQDACVSSERLMTPVDLYESRIAQALATFQAGRPGGRVFVASVPDVGRLWRIGKDSPVARGFWAVGRICPTMLARPTSASEADRARRERVRARIAGYNAALARVCVAYGPGCRHDGGQVFAQPFTLGHVSKWDFFHPNAAGQRLIAEKTFRMMRDWLAEPVVEPLPAP